MAIKDRIKKKRSNDDFDYERYEKEVVLGLMSGKGLTGKDGLLKPLISRFVEAALDALS
jgi:hypothetical protein